MNGSLVIAISVLLQAAAVAIQLFAAGYALKLIRVTGKSPAWILISTGFCLMALRRSIMVWYEISGVAIDRQDFWDALIAVTISTVMLSAVLAIRPLFQSIKDASVVLQQDKATLEKRVAERTGELNAANALLAVELDERRRTELKLAQYVSDLARSNAELEQFAYVASHDLQEPLRMVASFTQLLGKRYRGKLDKDADEFIGYAVDGATRMQGLINDLLMYSRAGARKKPLVTTDLNEILAYAEANLGEAIREVGVVVTHEKLPYVVGDQVQLTQLFQNLLANAIKFRSDEPLLIQVKAMERNGDWVLSIKDNGIGIAPEHQARIFAIFQRLHTRSEYPGTGIGLAICKKIVERHGGQIWVESALGKGATFYFNLHGSKENNES